MVPLLSTPVTRNPRLQTTTRNGSSDQFRTQANELVVMHTAKSNAPALLPPSDASERSRCRKMELHPPMRTGLADEKQSEEYNGQAVVSTKDVVRFTEKRQKRR